MHPVATSLNKIKSELNGYFLERAEFIDAALLAVVAKEHFFALGPPGTSKSQLIRAIAHSITGARYFEVALSKTTPIEKVMGPLDLKVFRETGDYKLKRAGFASQVEYMMADEVGKMSPVTGHDMLALANERVYHEVNGGVSVHEAPLMTMFTASNEMITTESENAAAFWDRLLIRCSVDYLSDASHFEALLTMGAPVFTETVDFDELRKAIEVDVPAIPLSRDALSGMVKLRKQFQIEHLYPSDRRWRASVRVLQAAAFLAGREQVEEDDLSVLRFTLWDTIETKSKVADLCTVAANPFASALIVVKQLLTEVRDEIDTAKAEEERKAQAEGRVANGYELMQPGREAHKKLERARDALRDVKREAGTREVPGWDETWDALRDAYIYNGVTCLSQTEDEAQVLTERVMSK